MHIASHLVNSRVFLYRVLIRPISSVTAVMLIHKRETVFRVLPKPDY